MNVCLLLVVLQLLHPAGARGKVQVQRLAIGTGAKPGTQLLTQPAPQPPVGPFTQLQTLERA